MTQFLIHVSQDSHLLPSLEADQNGVIMIQTSSKPITLEEPAAHHLPTSDFAATLHLTLEQLFSWLQVK